MKFLARRKKIQLIQTQYFIPLPWLLYIGRFGTNVTVRIPVPKATVSVSHELLGPGQVSELRQQDKTNIWKIKKMEGGCEQILILKVSEELGHALSYKNEH